MSEPVPEHYWSECRKCGAQTVVIERFCRHCGFDRHQHRSKHLRGPDPDERRP